MHLIFDLDGTLVDSLPGIASALNQTLRDYELQPYPASEVRGFVGNGTLELCRRALAKQNDPPTAIDSLARKMNASFQTHYATSWHAGTTLYPHIDDTLQTLAAEGAQLAVLSNKPQGFTGEIVNTLFPSGIFSQIVGQCPDLPRKPAPDPALFITRAWGIAPHQALIIGDSSIDLETAKAAHIPFLGVAWGYHDASQLATNPVSDPANLLSRIRQIAST